LDSDDILYPEALHNMVETALRENADVVASQTYYSYPNGKNEAMSNTEDLTSSSLHKEKVALMRPLVCSKLIKKSIIDQNGLKFPENIKRFEDMPFTVPLLMKTDKISILPKAMYYYRQRDNSLSSSNNNITDFSFYDRSYEAFFEKIDNSFQNEIEYRAAMDYIYGKTMLMLRSKYKSKKIEQHIDSFNEKYPNWQNNSYMQKSNSAKKTFIKTAAKKRILMLKILIFAWDMKRKLRGN